MITLTLTESEIQNTTVDFGSMDYIFENKKYETETISQEAYELCRADLAERAAKEKDMLVLAKEEVNIAANEPALSQVRSICELATLECYYHNVAKSTKTKGTGLAHVGEKERKFWIEYTGVARIGIDMSDVNMKDNRSRYNEEIEKYQSMDQFQVGIAVFDLNGLKKINDKQGHKFGDILIRNTAKYLCSLFEHKIYRIGGDEFVVFDPDTTETQFYDNVRSVCEMMNNNISISVGVTWAEHGKEFNEKIMEADWRMYEQKNAYHQQQQAAQQELLQ